MNTSTRLIWTEWGARTVDLRYVMLDFAVQSAISQFGSPEDYPVLRRKEQIGYEEGWRIREYVA